MPEEKIKLVVLDFSTERVNKTIAFVSFLVN
jgi:hypothetical protein